MLLSTFKESEPDSSFKTMDAVHAQFEAAAKLESMRKQLEGLDENSALARCLKVSYDMAEKEFLRACNCKFEFKTVLQYYRSCYWQ